MHQTYITADTHFGHKGGAPNQGIIHHAARPWPTIEEHDEALIANYNSVVDRKDTVIIVGDFAWKNHAYYLNRLNGSKILVRGNHDDFSKKIESQFSSVHDILERKFNGQRIIFCHYPMRGWKGAATGSWMAHGHHHGTAVEDPGSCCCDVGVDVWDYKPISIDTLALKMKRRLEYRAAHSHPQHRADNLLAAQQNRMINQQILADAKSFDAAAFWAERQKSRQASQAVGRVDQDSGVTATASVEDDSIE